MKQTTYFDETDYKWVIGGLVTAIGGLVLFIKEWATKLLTKRNNDIETRLVAVEKGQIDIMKKITIINHKIDNQDIAEAGAFKLILEEIKELKNDRIFTR